MTYRSRRRQYESNYSNNARPQKAKDIAKAQELSDQEQQDMANKQRQEHMGDPVQVDDPWAAGSNAQHRRLNHAAQHTVTLTPKYDQVWYHAPAILCQTPYNPKAGTWHHEPAHHNGKPPEPTSPQPPTEPQPPKTHLIL